MKKLARLISFVFSPLLVPTYSIALALWCSYLSFAPLSARMSVTGVMFIITCLLPLVAIGLLWKSGYLSDPGLNNRAERTIPYIITAVSYLAAGFYLWRANAPLWLVMFPVGGALAALVSLLINRRWKISAHMAAMGGMFALVLRIAVGGYAVMNMLWTVAIIVLLCGAVATSRLILERHTMGQVCAGFANGFLCVFLLSIFF